MMVWYFMYMELRAVCYQFSEQENKPNPQNETIYKFHSQLYVACYIKYPVYLYKW